MAATSAAQRIAGCTPRKRSRWSYHLQTLSVAVVGVAALLGGCILVGQGLYMHAKAQVAQVLLADAFAKAQATGHPAKPWAWADTWPVARIRVPRLSQNVIALAGASGQAMAFGPGHLAQTAPPGAVGTTVFSAHRDTHFAFLRHVVAGDVIEVENIAGEHTRYRVTHHAVRRFDDVTIATAPRVKHVILTTCFPFDAITEGPLRFLVFATALPE